VDFKDNVEVLATGLQVGNGSTAIPQQYVPTVGESETLLPEFIANVDHLITEDDTTNLNDDHSNRMIWAVGLLRAIPQYDNLVGNFRSPKGANWDSPWT
jgi:hypothetical protein